MLALREAVVANEEQGAMRRASTGKCINRELKLALHPVAFARGISASA